MRKYLRAALMAGIAFAVIFVVANGGQPFEKDYIAFWNSAHALASHQDPYVAAPSPQTPPYEPVLDESDSADAPKLMATPPWAMFLVAPLRYVSAEAGLIAWMALSLLCVAICVWIFKVSHRDRVLAYCFAPVFGAIASGQSSPFILLGLSIFFTRFKRQPLVAGASVLLILIKPQLFLVLVPILLLDCVFHRRLRVLAGSALAFLAAGAFATRLDPQIWSGYVNLLRSAEFTEHTYVTPAAVLNDLLPQLACVQFVPCGLAVLWGVGFYWKRRLTWDWAADGIPVLLVSVLTAPYASVADQIVLLPAVLVTMASTRRAPYTATLFMAINAVVLTLLVAQVELPSLAYAWTSLAWLGWHLYSRRSFAKVSGQTLAAALEA